MKYEYIIILFLKGTNLFQANYFQCSLSDAIDVNPYWKEHT